MEPRISRIKEGLLPEIDTVAKSIIDAQRETGEIPWCDGDKTDPWDLVESIMGLTIGGYISEARLSFTWMEENQLEDGSWYASYKNGVPEDKTHDTNMSSYIAVGVFHHYLVTGDTAFLENSWSMVKKGINFAISLLAPTGELYWAKSPEGVVEHKSLLTGSSSVYMSLKCALAMALELGHEMPEWIVALKKIGNTLRTRRHIFDVSKSRFSMDWFYPILTGALQGKEAQKRIDKYWSKFVIEGEGVRCVSDQPWVTVAETSEFVIALSAMGSHSIAEDIFQWILDKTFEDGSYWCGYTFPDMVVWPEDKLTWTNAVVIMAADTLYQLTPASQLFSHNFWKQDKYKFIFENEQHEF